MLARPAHPWRQVALCYVGSTVKKISDIIHHKQKLDITEKVLFGTHGYWVSHNNPWMLPLGVDAFMIVVLMIVIVLMGRRALRSMKPQEEVAEADDPSEESCLVGTFLEVPFGIQA